MTSFLKPGGLGWSELALELQLTSRQAQRQGEALLAWLQDAATSTSGVGGPDTFMHSTAAGSNLTVPTVPSAALSVAPSVTSSAAALALPRPRARRQRSSAAEIVCERCARGDHPDQVLLCDGCDRT